MVKQETKIEIGGNASTAPNHRIHFRLRPVAVFLLRCMTPNGRLRRPARAIFRALPHWVLFTFEVQESGR